MCLPSPPTHPQPRSGGSTFNVPVVPSPAVSVGILGQVGSEEEAAASGLTPGTLAGVGEAFGACGVPGAEEKNNVKQW